MTEDHSFDPRTWKAAEVPSPTASIAVARPVTEARPQPGEPARTGWLGMALSFTILLGGAAAAYSMRPPQDVLDAATLNAAEPAAALLANG